MNFTALLDTAIGLSLVYLAASLFVTIMNEAIAGIFGLRGWTLARHLKKLLGDTGLVPARGLEVQPIRDLINKPGSYVDPRVLAQTLVGGLLSADKTAKATVEAVRASIESIQAPAVRNALLAAVVAAGDDVEKVTASLADWLDRSLKMLGEGYKKWMQVLSFGLGAVIAVGLNIDTVGLTQRLYQDKELREATVQVAVQTAQSTTPEVFKKCLAETDEDRQKDKGCDQLRWVVDGVAGRNAAFGELPIGRHDGYHFAWSAVLGWLLTALALSLGAPFWFDLLNRFVNVRNAIRPDTATKNQ